VVAKGSASLLAEEMRAQRLMTLLQIIMGNPAYKEQEIVADLAKQLGIPPNKVILSDEETMAIQEQQAAMAQQGVDPAQAGTPNVANPASAGPGGGAPQQGAQVSPAPQTQGQIQ